MVPYVYVLVPVTIAAPCYVFPSPHNLRAMPTPTKTPQSQQPCSEAEGAQLLEAAATLMKGGEEQASLSLFGWQLSYRKRAWCAEPKPQSLHTLTRVLTLTPTLPLTLPVALPLTTHQRTPAPRTAACAATWWPRLRTAKRSTRCPA